MDLKVVFNWEIRPDDGKDGNFWRNGERWIRQRGRESRIKDLAPHLEAQAEAELDMASMLGYQLTHLQIAHLAAREKSKSEEGDDGK